MAEQISLDNLPIWTAEEEEYIRSLTGEGSPPARPADRGHVLDVLGWLQRPQHAITQAIVNARDDDPNTTFLGGLRAGMSGRSQITPADAVGMEEGQPTDEWLPWLKKEVPRFGVNAVLDPLVVVPFGKIAQGVKKLPAVARGIEKVAASSFGKSFLHEAPGALGDKFEEALNIAKRKAGQGSLAARKLYDEAARAIKESGIDPAVVREAWETGQELPSQVADPLAKLLGISTKLVEEMNPARVAEGLEPIGLVKMPKGEWIPRVQTEKGRRAIMSEGKVARPEEFKSRELLKVEGQVDEAGNPLIMNTKWLEKNPNEIPIDAIGEAGKIKRGPQGEYYYKGQPLQLAQATLADIKKGVPKLKDAFVEGAPESYLADIFKKLNQKAFLGLFDDTVSAGITEGWLKDAAKGAIPDGWRTINVKGLEKYAAPGSIANRLENEAGKLGFDTETTLGTVGKLLQTFGQSRPGRALKTVTDTWKSTTLPLHPGFHAANVVSNQFLEALKGTNPLIRNPQAVAVQLGRDPQLWEDLAARGVIGSGWAGSEMSDQLQKALRGPRKLDRVPGVSQAVRGLEWLQNKGYAFGGKLEDNAKIAVALDYLAKHPEFATATGEARELILDRAAQAAKDALFDYSSQGLTPFENQLRQVIPFYGWQRAIIGSTLDRLVHEPWKLALLGRGIDEAATPLSDREKRLADAWVRESGPVKRLLGIDLGRSDKGLQQMLMIGRFLPHGNIEQLMSRPLDFAMGAVNPYLRAPYELLANRSTFKDRPIDPAADGFPWNVINPLIGKPYTSAGGQYFGWTPPASTEYLASITPGYRYLTELNRSAQLTGLVPHDVYKDQDDLSDFGAWYATGGKRYSYDPERYTKNRNREWKTQESALKYNMRYALQRGDTATAERLRRQIAEHHQDRWRRLGYVESGS